MGYLHQIWFNLGASDVAPHSTRRYLIREMNPDLEYRLWSLSDANKLVSQHYPQYMSLWNSFPHGINKADFFRYILMHRFGGIYFDLDFVCCRSLQPLMKENTVVLGEEWPYSFRDATVHNGALVSGSPFHPFWVHVMEEIRKLSGKITDGDRSDIQKSVFKLTGTAMLRDAVLSYWQTPTPSRTLLIAPFFIFCTLVSQNNFVTSYKRIPSKGSWMFPQESDVRQLSQSSHTFTFIAPAYKTWQTSFQKLRK
jgi:mannosyltransferase OCH1-like enzyme